MPKDLRGLDTVDPDLFWRDFAEYRRQSREAALQTGPVRPSVKEGNRAAPKGTPPNEEGNP